MCRYIFCEGDDFACQLHENKEKTFFGTYKLILLKFFLQVSPDEVNMY